MNKSKIRSKNEMVTGRGPTGKQLSNALYVVKNEDYQSDVRIENAKFLIRGLENWLNRSDLSLGMFSLPNTPRDQGKQQVLLEYVQFAFAQIILGTNVATAFGLKRPARRPKGGFEKMERDILIAVFVVKPPRKTGPV